MGGDREADMGADRPAERADRVRQDHSTGAATHPSAANPCANSLKRMRMQAVSREGRAPNYYSFAGAFEPKKVSLKQGLSVSL